MSAERYSRFAKRLNYWIQITRSAYSNWSALLGTIIGCIALCNLVFRLFHVSVFEALAWFLAAYQKTFHPPIAFIFSWLPFALPVAAKDLLLLYMAMVGVLYRSLSYAPSDQSLHIHQMYPMSWRQFLIRAWAWAGKIIAAVAWPYFLKGMLTKPHLLVMDAQHRDRGRLPHMDRKEAEALLTGDPGNPVVFCDERELIVCYFVALFAAVLAVVLLNAAINDLKFRF